MAGLRPFRASPACRLSNGPAPVSSSGRGNKGGNDDRLFRSGVRDGGQPVRGDRQSPVDPDGRARPPAAAETGDDRLLSDPSRRRLDRGVRGLSRAASPHPRPDQGRHPVCPVGRYRRGGGAGDLDELEMRAGRPALWRRQGRRPGRSLHHFEARTGGAVAPLHAGDDSVRRAAYRRDGAGHGHQRAGDGLVHGHLFDVSGPHRDRDRHRQAGGLRRHAGTPRSHRARRRASRQAGDERIVDQSEQRHRRDPGVWQCRLLCRAGAASVRPQGDRGQRSYRRAARSKPASISRR